MSEGHPLGAATTLDKARRNRLGLCGYVTILAALPASVPRCAESLGRDKNGLATLMREFRQVGLVGCEGQDRSVLRGVAPIWGVGDYQRERLSGAPRPQVIAFASPIRALVKHPRSIKDLVLETGLSHSVVLRVVAALRAHGLSRTYAWRKRHGAPAALHGWGGGADAPAPPPMGRRAINAGFNARRQAALRRRERLKAIPCSVFALGSAAQ